MQIEITEDFWRGAVMTAYELFQYPDADGNRISAECLGELWGDKSKGVFRVRFGTTTQLIEDRDEGSVVGPDPFEHVLHNAWATLDVADANYLGAFHSHPWNEQEIQDHLNAGNTDTILWRASDGDKQSMPNDCIEIILSLRPLPGVDPNQYEWNHRGLLISGRIDVAHVTLSGWYKDESGIVSQVRVTATFFDAVNRRIEQIDNRT